MAVIADKASTAVPHHFNNFIRVIHRHINHDFIELILIGRVQWLALLNAECFRDIIIEAELRLIQVGVRYIQADIITDQLCHNFSLQLIGTNGFDAIKNKRVVCNNHIRFFHNGFPHDSLCNIQRQQYFLYSFLKRADLKADVIP
ncbi:hypothetical protein SDC9_176024 [bioreactor metagenome]|uniref:Uncharacterized protein n=1 Tax=bioreactor metagenome TaxID=1076179 RepID=A0A645GRK9_9ZZZZ